MRSRLVLAVLPVALLGLAVGSSTAAPKPRSISKTYGVTAPVPGGYAICDGTPTSQIDDFKVPAAGTLKVELVDFQGDWDLFVQSAGKTLGESTAGQPIDGPGETVQLKLKRATTVQVNACNYSGGPTGTVKILFTYK